MKPLTLLLTIQVLSCGSTGNNLPATDSTQTVIKDTPAARPAVVTKDTTSLGGTWFLQAVLASDTATGKIPMLQFNLASKKMTGNTGCNKMSGSFNFTDSTLSFNQDIITTKMACVGYNEGAFLKSLLRTNGYHLENGMLILMVDQTALSRWTRKVAPKPISNKT